MLCWELPRTCQALDELGGLEQEQGSTPGSWLQVAGLDSGLGAVGKEQRRATVCHHAERQDVSSCPLPRSGGGPGHRMGTRLRVVCPKMRQLPLLRCICVVPQFPP